MDVVVMAAMVPMGIDFWASRRSPERLEPAMIPEHTVEKQTWSRSEIHTHKYKERVGSSRISIHSYTWIHVAGIVNGNLFYRVRYGGI